MKTQSNARRRGPLLMVAVAVATLAAAGTVMAYTVVTRDGHRIDVQSRPEIRGLQAWMRLQPHGQLAIMQEDRIDWERTDAANPAMPHIAVPSSTKMTVIPEAPSGPIEFKLKGIPAPKAATAPEAGKGAAAPGQGSEEQRRINAQEAIIKLQKEYAQVASARDQESAKKKSLEDELGELQNRVVGHANENSAAQQRIRELQQMISDSSARIGRLELRLAEIRSAVVEQGGSLD